MANSLKRLSLLALLTLSIGACQTPATQADPIEETPAPAIDRLQEAKDLGVLNARLPEEGLLCSGQLQESQLVQLSASGYQTFINLRTAKESGTGWEAERAGELGVTYIQIPVAGADGINEANARQLADALDGAKRPVVLYCGSSNRVGALYGLSAFYTQGKSPEESLALAESAGVTRLKPRLMEALGMQER